MPQRRNSPGKKRERPRDELGRPLPWGEVNRLQMEDFDSQGIEENHRLAVDHFNEGRFFPAHEAWESCWKQARGTPDEEFFKGLSQLGAGYVHFRRGNAHGSHVLLRRALWRLRRFGPAHRGIDLEGLAGEVEAQARVFEAAEREAHDVPEVTPPRVGTLR